MLCISRDKFIELLNFLIPEINGAIFIKFGLAPATSINFKLFFIFRVYNGINRRGCSKESIF